MSDNEKKGFWKTLGYYTGFYDYDAAASEQRSTPVVEPMLPAGTVAAPISRNRSTVVTAERAIGLVSVYRAVSILSTATKQLPVSVWRNGLEIETPSLIKNPSLTQSRASLIEETVMSLALTGNAYWRLQRRGQHEPVMGIEVLNPHMVVIEYDPANGQVKEFRYGDKVFKPWQVQHMSLLRIPGSPYGLGPIQAAQASLLGAIDVRDYASNWFAQGGVPNGILKTDQTLSPDDADMYKRRWEETTGAGRGVAVLGQGTSYQPIYLSPADAQFIETQEFTKTEVATLFGVPAIYMLADGGNSMTYTNTVQVDTAFVRYTLTQYLNEIEQAFSDLLPRGQEARFSVEGLLRADQKTRFEGYAIADFMTVNEKRAKEGLPPIAGGDELAKPAAAPVPKAQIGPEGGSDN